MKITLKILKADGSGIKDKEQIKKYLFKKIMKILQQRQESMVFEPRQFPITRSPSSVRQRLELLQRRTKGSLSTPSPPSPSQRALFLEGARHQHFSSCPQLSVAKSKPWVSVVER